MKDKTKIGLEYETKRGTIIIDQIGILHKFKNLRFEMFRDRNELFGDSEIDGKTQLIMFNIYKIKEV